MVSEESPACTAPTVNFYDAVNKTASRAPDGRMTHFAYDDRHRLISKTWEALGGQNDAGARTLSYDLAGNLKSVTDPYLRAVECAYEYDSHNRVTAETSTGVTHHYFYDAAGNRAVVTYGGQQGSRLVSEFDSLNRLSSLVETPASGTARTTTWEYDLVGIGGGRRYRHRRGT